MTASGAAPPVARARAALLRNRPAAVGLGTIAVIAACCFLGPLVYRTDQLHVDLAQAAYGPSAAHPLGTDEVGHDQLGRLLLGGRAALEVGVAAAVLATLFGALWGAVAGYAGGIVDAVMMRIVDALLAIPALFLLMFLSAISRPNTGVMIGVIALVAWLAPARLVRGEALTLRTRDHVRSVKLMGGGSWRAVLRHVAPNAVGTVVVNATFQVADAVLLLAALSFLGLGVPPPSATWGDMLSRGINHTSDGCWWLIYPPGLAIVLVVVAFNLIGEALRDSIEGRVEGRVEVRPGRR